MEYKRRRDERKIVVVVVVVVLPLSLLTNRMVGLAGVYATNDGCASLEIRQDHHARLNSQGRPSSEERKSEKTN